MDKDMFADLFDNADPALRLAADLAELTRRFAAGEFDLVGVGRMQIANPDFVAKLESGRLDALASIARRSTSVTCSASSSPA